MSKQGVFAYRGEKWNLERVVFRYGKSDPALPRLIVVAAIHGNEPSGLRALLDVQEELKQKAEEMQGEVIALIGNFRALEAGVRFMDVDLNRMWNGEAYAESLSEYQEKKELKELLDEVLSGEGKRYVIDLHTTSSDSPPFLSIADSAANKVFARATGVRSVNGIERFIKGALLEYVTSLGHVGMAFEAGQHQASSSVDSHRDFILKSLSVTGILGSFEVEERDLMPLYDIIYRHGISPADEFKMNPGYENFSPVQKGDPIARDRRGDINAPETGLLFMPLYQEQGDDGFFIVK